MQVLSRFNLDGRKALVTGASRGLGQTIAEALASAGADVAVTARNADDLIETASRISAHGRTSVALSLDVRDVDACAATISKAASALSSIDILVNNAGFEEVRPSLDVDEALWDRVVSTNLKGAFFCAQAAARQMMNSGNGGSIINLCSLTSYVGVPTAVPYGSSKSGLMGMTHALAAEWAPHNIRVNGIAPGYFRTAMTNAFYENEEWRKSMLSKIPQGRFGKLEDVAGAVVFLAGEASAYVTGQVIPIDGGYLASI